MFPPSANLEIYSASVNSDDILYKFTRHGSWDLLVLYQNVEERFQLPTVKCFILYYKNLCLTYCRNENFRHLEYDLNNTEGPLPLKIAVCYSEDPEIVATCENDELPMLSPINVKTRSGELVYTLEKLHPFTTVDYLIYKISEALSISPNVIELYHHLKLDANDLLADLYFESGTFDSTVEIVFIRSDLDSTVLPTFNQLAIDFLSGKTVIDVAQEKISSVHTLKEFINKTRKIPINQQRLLHQGTVLKDYESLNDRYLLEDYSSNTSNMVITLMVLPHYVKVKFISDVIEIPDDSYMEFSRMTSVKEMNVRIAEATNICAERLALMSDSFDDKVLSTKYEDDLMLHELDLFYDATIKVVRSVCVVIQRGNAFEYLVRRKEETIKEMRKELEKSHGYKERDCKLVLQVQKDAKGILKNSTHLIKIPDDVIIRFEERKSCVLL